MILPSALAFLSGSCAPDVSHRLRAGAMINGLAWRGVAWRGLLEGEVYEYERLRGKMGGRRGKGIHGVNLSELK